MLRRGPLAALAALLLSILVVAGCAGTGGGDGTAASDGTSTAQAHPEALATVGSDVHPTKIVVQSIGAASSLVPVGLSPDHTMATPPVSHPEQAAWFDRSPVPGNIGPAIIVGHINGGGRPGVFAHLGEIGRGAEIDIDRSNGTTVSYKVSRVDIVPKNHFPTGAVYSDTGNSQVRLISCGGDLDRTAHSYESNVVVYADLVGAHRT